MAESILPEHFLRRFTGKVAVVTGGAAGIGAATARRLAYEGARVMIADIRDEAGAAEAAFIRSQGYDATYIRCDVASSADWERVRAALTADGGQLDVLHGNAYLEVAAAAHELEETDWDRQLAVTLKAAYLGVRALACLLRPAGGSVVLTSSVHALIGLRGRPAYAAAKGGLSALTRQLAVEYGPDIRVNAVVPGPILTRAWDGIDADSRGRSAAGTALRRLGRPEEVAAAVAFLASADGSYITGTNLVVDGGWSVFKDSS